MAAPTTVLYFVLQHHFEILYHLDFKFHLNYTVAFLEWY
jgi:hypothetical protein